MAVGFCVLGSGSAGNASLLLTPQAHILIDIGFGPDDIAERLAGTGASWDTIKAVVLSHTHADHLKKRTLNEIARRGIRFVCHTAHWGQLKGGRYFKKLLAAEGVFTYDGTAPVEVYPGVVFEPLPLPHDCPPTFGFRIEVSHGDGRTHRIGYLSDLGYETEGLAERLCHVDLLALEFNHDEAMEIASNRPQRLIDRVLGEEGHLSNRQAAAVFEHVLDLANGHGGPQTLVQMHLSEDCNRPELAYRAAMDVVERRRARTRIYSSKQHVRGTVHEIA